MIIVLTKDKAAGLFKRKTGIYKKIIRKKSKKIKDLECNIKYRDEKIAELRLKNIEFDHIYFFNIEAKRYIDREKIRVLKLSEALSQEIGIINNNGLRKDNFLKFINSIEGIGDFKLFAVNYMPFFGGVGIEIYSDMFVKIKREEGTCYPRCSLICERKNGEEKYKLKEQEALVDAYE